MTRLRSRLFTRLAALVSHHAVVVLLVAGAIAAGSVVYTLSGLTFDSNRNDLISQDLAWNQRFLQWRSTFTGTSDLLVVVDAHPDPGAARAFVDDLGPKLAQSRWIAGASWGLNPQNESGKLIRTLPMPRFKRELGRIARAGPLLRSDSPKALVDSTTAALTAQSIGGSAKAVASQLGRFADVLHAFDKRLKTPANRKLDLAAMTSPGPSWQYLSTTNGRLLLIRLKPKEAPGALNPLEPAITSTRRLLAQARAQSPKVKAGLTGIAVIEADETATATRDSTVSSIVAAVLIAVLLMLAFHSVRTPVLLMVTLGMGIAWSFGFLTLVIGHLQVISVVFTVILLGLGVAFGIHLAARFEMVRHDFPDDEQGFTDALAETMRTVGPGLVTGAVTTAAAFCTTMLTDYRGVAEMGLIAAAGVLLCLVAMLTVFPAMLRLVKGRSHHIRPLENRWVHFFEERWVKPFWKAPRITLAVAGLITAASLVGVSRMGFDYNLLKLLPRGVASVTWNNRLTSEGGQAVYSGISVADGFDAARRRAARLRGLPTVAGLGGAGMLFPPDLDAKLDRIKAAGRQLAPALQQAAHAKATAPAGAGGGDTPSLVDKLADLQSLIGAAAGRVPPDLKPPFQRVRRALGKVVGDARQLDPATRRDRLAALGRDFARWRRSLAKRIHGALDPSPIGLADVPKPMMNTFVAPQPDGPPKLAIEVYPNLPPGITEPLDPRFLGTFVRSLEQVDPMVTGVIVQVYHAGSLILRSYTIAGALALGAVLVLVWLDFGNLRDAALAMIPTAVGFAATFGLLALMRQSINPANIIVLPLMFGIGVDAGVHILHRYQHQPNARPPGLTSGTGKGVSVTSYTTIIGFGSMLLAHHRGIFGLGLTLSLGITLTLGACWTVMPAWLELRTQRRQRRAAQG